MASLNIKNDILGYQNAAHLVRRTTFCPSKNLINQLATLTAVQAVELLFINTTYDNPEPIAFDTGQKWIPTYLTPTPTTSSLNDSQQYYTVFSWWLKRAEKQQSIHNKASLFLITIFTCNYPETSNLSTFGLDYFNLFDYYATGNLKTLAKKISRLNSMHAYLDNNLNVVGAPNENYAREFLELFTIGKGPQDGIGSYTNYTEHDVQQAARILTGFTNIQDNQRLDYLDSECHIPLGKKIFTNHDTGNKTFSAKFGNQTIVGATNEAEMDVELDAFIDMVFAQPETAKNYARKLYRYFVRRNIDTEIETDIILPLANNLLATEYNLASTMKMLLKSVHFYDEDDSINGDEIIGSKIKSPLELILFMHNQFNVTTPNPLNAPSSFVDYYFNFVWSRIYNNGFKLFMPITVAGYPAYYESPMYDKLWIDAPNLLYRFNNSLVQLINGVTYNGVTTKLNIVDYVQNSGDYSNPSNAITLINEFLELCFCSMPTGDRYNYFKQALLGNLSIINWQHEWNNYVTTGNDSSVKVALERFVKAVVQSPEYQLF